MSLFLLQLTALKSQMDNDAKSIERTNAENSSLRGSIVDLKGRITALEGQVKRLI